MPVKNRNAHDELARLQAAVREAEKREREAHTAITRSARELHAKRGQLRDLYLNAEVEGKPAPTDAVAKLTKQINEHEARMETRQVSNPLGAEHPKITLRFDLAAEARHHVAYDAVTEAQNDVGAFIRSSRDELAAEMTDRSLAARDRLLEAIEELGSATGNWTGCRRDWIAFGEQWGTVAPIDVPLTPIDGSALQKIELAAAQARGGARDPRGAIPMPARLAPGRDQEAQRAKQDGQEVRDQNPLRGWETQPPDNVSSEAGTLGFSNPRPALPPLPNHGSYTLGTGGRA